MEPLPLRYVDCKVQPSLSAVVTSKELNAAFDGANAFVTIEICRSQSTAIFLERCRLQGASCRFQDLEWLCYRRERSRYQ